MNLPSEPTIARQDAEGTVTLLHSDPKGGKSTLASKAPKPLFLATEPGLAFLSVYELPIRTWQEMLEALAAVAKDPKDFKTLVIDTVDIAYLMCSEHVCNKHDMSHPSDMGYGKGFALVNNEFRRVLNKVTRLTTADGSPFGVVLVSHTKRLEIDSRDGKYIKAVPTLPQSPREIVCGMADFIFYLDSIDKPDGEQERVLRTKPSKAWEAGDRSGKLPEILHQDWEAVAAHLEPVKPKKKKNKQPSVEVPNVSQ